MAELVGGQAVIEGVMMRCGNKVAVATVKEGKIKVKRQCFKPLSEKIRILKMPFIRGVSSLLEMMYLGIKTLIYSANEFTDEEEELSKKELFLTILVSVVLTIGLFIVLPLVITKLLTKDHGLLFNLIDGLLRIGIFIAYLVGISLMKDIRRIFEYHGAEHKAVNCYEDKRKMTVKNVKKYPTLHPRCGTTFILIVLVIGVLIFSLVTTESFLVKLGSRIILLPVIAGVSYEVLKLGSRFGKNLFFKQIISPGLMLQKITTREPDDIQIKAAICALEDVVDKEK